MSQTGGFGEIKLGAHVMASAAPVGVSAGGSVSLVSDAFTLPLQAHVAAQLGAGMDGEVVPIPFLQKMRLHPDVYLAEFAITGILRRPDLYTIRHPNPIVKATIEAWLWPLLYDLGAAGGRAFAYGSVPVKLRVARRPIRVLVPTRDGTKTRKKTTKPLQFYDKVDEIRPDLVTPRVNLENELVEMIHEGRSYGPLLVHVFKWDPEFGSWAGQGARRRGWRDWCEYLLDAMLENMYLERSVDAPRKAHSPKGTTTLGGVEYDNLELMRMIGMGLRGSGVASLPGETDDKGNRLFDLDVLDIPDRSDVWDRAIRRRGGNLFLAYLVAPALGGADDLGGAAGKTIDGLMREFVENLAVWMATKNLQRLVDVFHDLNYGEDEERAEVGISDVGKAHARKTLLAIAQMVNQSPEGEIAYRTDVPGLLDRLGGPLRDAPPPPFDRSAGKGAGGDEKDDGEGEKRPPGRPRDLNGEREERREDARDEDGEDATGAKDEGDGLTKPAPGPRAAAEPESEGQEQDAAGAGEKESPERAQPPPPSSAAPKGQIFGYHLQQAVVKINEAREQLGLPPMERGDLTVPEFLALLQRELAAQGAGGSPAPANGDVHGEDADEQPDGEES